MQSPHGIAQTLLHATQAPTSVLFPRVNGLRMVLRTPQLYQHEAWNVLAQSSLACLHRASKGLPIVYGFVLATHGDSSLGRKKFLFLSCIAMPSSPLIHGYTQA
ncbi:hypothetical protein Pint_18073 [Pistacia integerrima]|uniref:Uncharacterized protein n=1 Tax=Pistacia integerrima TaxID=434235 RepID=A0ACC0YX88_9ROSI|nr:hypothetical protein Pint_18073 [Pistacia integerrima]